MPERQTTSAASVPVSRRDALAALAGAAVGLAGCGERGGRPSDTGTAAAATDTATLSGHVTPTRRPETATTDPREMTAFRQARDHLDRAFAEWAVVDPFDEGTKRVQFVEREVRAFDLDALLSAVERAREAIDRGDRRGHRDHPYVAALKASALVAELGGRAYHEAGKAFLEVFRHRRLYTEERAYGRAADAARRAKLAVQDVGGYAGNLVDGYRSVVTDPGIDHFDVERWGEVYLPFVVNFGRRQPPVTRGARHQALAMDAFVAADRLVRGGTDYAAAAERVDAAADRLRRAREAFRTAVDRNAVMFRDYWQGRLFCHSRRFDEPFELFADGVAALREDSADRGGRMVADARSQLRTALVRCA